MLCAVVKCAMVLAKRPQCLLFSTAQVRNEYSPQLSKLFYNCKLKNKEALSEDGVGRILLKTFRVSLFNEDLSNEPNFGRIHLAGQYL
jgi:hypothetical protein